jgi:phospholipid N-methyltransferase
MNSGLPLFLREILTNPGAMGAACPSSKRLANKIAGQVPLSAGLTLELGGGTGVVTSALLQRKILPKNLVVIERSAALAEHLQTRFPQLKILQGDASELTKLLGTSCLKANVVVSSLPLRSLPAKTVQSIGAQLENILVTGGLYIQFTYSLHRSPLIPSPHLQWLKSEYIWLNIPPARVEVFRYVK